ncbi:hypothetical protein JST97_36060 [bacterium]|nr:hypothetical protein [bacterium]
MRKLLQALVLSLLVAVPSWAENATLDFQLYNRTGVNIKKLYVSPSNAQDWEDDLMHGRMLLHGSDVTIEFQPEHSATTWDLRVEDSDGGALIFEDLDLSQTNQLILNADHTATFK